MKINQKFYKLIIIVSVLSIKSASAGPPFFTDDPQPVDLKHWELYLASQMNFSYMDVDMTAPHIEINYGAITDIQLHIVAPLGYVKTKDGKNYGYRDTEIGVKYRIVNSEDLMIGIFPLVELPTGNESKQLGNGKTQLFLPIWIQKSWGKFQSYFGVGYWINPGTGNNNYTFAGWQAQYDFSKTVTLGGEIYYKSSDSQEAVNSIGFNVGGFINVSGLHHILFSFGKSLSHPDYTGYIGYQLTI